MKRTGGFSLIELLIVVGIIGVLAAIAVPNVSEFVRRNRIQNQARRIYSDLSSMRMMALHTNRTHFMQFGLANNAYRVLEDTNGNNQANEPPADTLRLNRKESPFTWSNTALVNEPVTTNPVGFAPTFDSRGYATQSGTICMMRTGGLPETGTVTNCVVVSPTRIRIGKIASNGGCNENSCSQQ